MSEPAQKLDGSRPVAPVKEAPSVVGSGPQRPKVRDLRKQRARRLGVRLGLAVGLPTVLAAVYYGLICTPQYESVASFTIQSADSGMAPSLDFLMGSVPGGGSAGRDVRLVQEYILSRSMLRFLEEEHGFVEHYSQGGIDWISRLPPDAPMEDRFDYYEGVVRAEFETESGALALSVRAFDADKAKELTDAILAASEGMVNRMMTDARQDRLQLARREVDAAEQRLTAARERIRELQADRSQLDPRAQAEATMHVKSSLEAQLAEARAELSTLRVNLQPGAPQLLAQQQRVAALSGQIASQQRRLTSRGEEGIDADLAAFEPALVEKEIAERTYESAVTSLEMARIEADRQHRYLVTIATPSDPDEPTHPRLFFSILTVLVLSFAAFGIGSLILASIREHANL
jgi:capsular polysaccharide transport system permease protein